MLTEGQKVKRREWHSQKMATDPAYRASRKEQAAKYRSNNREATNQRCKDWAKKNPDYFWERDLKKFGLTKQEYQNKLMKQDGICAICSSVTKSRLCVDHCHTTGIVRGLLCGNCNKALGLFKDNPDLMRTAAIYVENYYKNPTD